MNITTRTTVTHILTIDGEDVIVPTKVADNIDPYVSDDKRILVYATHDEAPCEYEFPEDVTFISENHKVDNLQSVINAAHEDETLEVFYVGIYQHGLTYYQLHNYHPNSNDEWDYRIGAVIIIPNDKHESGYTDPERAARAICDEYTAYCNGDVYLVVTMVREGIRKWSEPDFIGGYYGQEQAEQAVKGGC